MLKQLNYIVNGQTLTGESFKMASDTVNEIKVSFAFEGTDWSGLDSIKAVFSNNRVASSYEAVLTNGSCTIPHEVLTEKGTVSVNLYGSIITGTTLTTRITSYKSACVDVLQKVNVSGSNSVVPTPATWQQELSAHTQNSNVHVTASEKQTWNAKADTEDIPTTLAELEGDSTHRTVTDAEKTAWGNKSTVSVSDEGTATDEVQYITVNGVEKKLPSGGIGEVEWGDIGGTLADQEDLAEALEGKAPTSHNHNTLYYGKSEVYNKTETDSAISNHHDSSKADASTTYTKSEVDSAISGHHDSTKADVGVSYTKAEEDALLEDKADAEDIPTKTSDLTNDSGFIDSTYHDNTKVDKVEGKGLSTNDYTSAEKTKLSGIEANADVTDNLNVKDALTDSSASAWADADKKACCGTIGAVYDGQYELIEEITLAEAVSSITRTQDTEGVAYNFKKANVLIAIPLADSAPNTYVRFTTDDILINGYVGGNTATNAIKYGTSRCENRDGFWVAYSNPYATGNATASNFYQNNRSFTATKITKIKVDGINGNLPAGTNIKIYGKWA